MENLFDQNASLLSKAKERRMIISLEREPPSSKIYITHFWVDSGLEDGILKILVLK